MVSSSSQESRFANASVQTLGGKMSKKELAASNREAAAAAAAQAAAAQQAVQQAEASSSNVAPPGTITEDELKAIVEKVS